MDGKTETEVAYVDLQPQVCTGIEVKATVTDGEAGSMFSYFSLADATHCQGEKQAVKYVPNLSGGGLLSAAGLTDILKGDVKGKPVFHKVKYAPPIVDILDCVGEAAAKCRAAPNFKASTAKVGAQP